MLYYLSIYIIEATRGTEWEAVGSMFNMFRYVTFRAAMAALLSLLIAFLLGPWLIRVLTEKQIGQQIRDDPSWSL